MQTLSHTANTCQVGPWPCGPLACTATNITGPGKLFFLKDEQPKQTQIRVYRKLIQEKKKEARKAGRHMVDKNITRKLVACI